MVEEEIQFRQRTNDTYTDDEEFGDFEAMCEQDPRMRRWMEQKLSKEQNRGSYHANKIVNPNKTPVSNRQCNRNMTRNNIMCSVKSPSDTTIYAPALHKELGTPTRTTDAHIRQGKGNDILDQISNFVEKIRIETTPSRPSGGHRTNDDEPVLTPAEKLVLDAEHFKATLDPSKGNPDLQTNATSTQLQQGPDLQELKNLIDILKTKCEDNGDDNEFFHVTCHVDTATREKIGRGEFIELEKLLPKTRTQVMNSNDEGIEVICNGSMYILPSTSNKESKINSVRCWEQAFRVYAAIYSEINPGRSAEIWQYVHVINTAAASFVWENVAFYDHTFRRLMESKPKRSWAKIYNQMWNLAMKDHINTRNQGNTSGYQGNHFNNAGTSKKFGDWRDRCCWRYNKGKCRKWDCKWDHHCNVLSCGPYSHPTNQCNKRKGNMSGNSNSTKSNSPAKANSDK